LSAFFSLEFGFRSFEAILKIERQLLGEIGKKPTHDLVVFGHFGAPPNKEL
jgi:hypothetical protein